MTDAPAFAPDASAGSSRDGGQPLFLYSTTVSDVGTVRSNNQDSSFAGERLIAICDGMGGHAGGDTASSIAIRSLVHLERDDGKGDVAAVAEMMERSVMAAHDAIVGKARREHRLAGMGTTVTAVSLVDGQWVVAHIGDSRAYLLRDGMLIRVTQDHSYVQHLIDTGRITPGEAKNHPQRNVVMRVLGDFDIDPRPDIAIRRAHPADRWLLCSDGLCGVLEDDTIREVLVDVSDLAECAQRLVSMALKAGSTDNVTAVIADATLALDADAFELPRQKPLVGGAASTSLEPIADILHEEVATAPALHDDGSPARRAARLAQQAAAEARGEQAAAEPSAPPVQQVAQPSEVRERNGERRDPDTGEIPVVRTSDGRVSADPNDPEVASAIRHEKVERTRTKQRRRMRKRVAFLLVLLALLAAAVAGAAGALAWSQTKYYVGDADGVVAIYRGVPTNVFGLELSHEVERTDVRTDTLPQTWQDELRQGIVRDSLGEARDHVAVIRKELKRLDDDGSHASDGASGTASGNGSGGSNASGGSGAASDGAPSSDGGTR